MSDELDGTDENSGDSEGIKSLRKQYEQTAKELKAAQERLAEIDKRERQTSVAELLKAKGVSPSAAKFYNGDDVSEDAVGKWIEDHADVFGLNKQEAQQVDPNEEAARRVSEASYGTTPTHPTPMGQVADPIEALRQMQSLPYEELVKLGRVPDPSTLWGVRK